MMTTEIHSEIFSGKHFHEAYKVTAPPPGLSEWIAFSWQSRFELLDEGVSAAVDERLFAHLSSSIVLSNGTPFTIENHEGLHEITEAVVIGHHTHPVLCHHRPDNRLTGLKLHPGGFYRMLGIPASLIRDTIIPLRDLFNGPAMPGADPQRLVQALMKKAYRPDAYKVSCVQQALQLHQWYMPENRSLEHIAAQLHLTPKTLNRYFRETLGLAPRKAFSIARIRKALTAWTQASSAGQPFSVYHYGYTDKSHFYKELKAYTSLHSLRLF